MRLLSAITVLGITVSLAMADSGHPSSTPSFTLSASSLYQNTFQNGSALNGFTVSGSFARLGTLSGSSPSPLHSVSVANGELVIETRQFRPEPPPNSTNPPLYTGRAAVTAGFAAVTGLRPVLETNPHPITWAFDVTSSENGTFTNGFAIVLACSHPDPFDPAAAGYAIVKWVLDDRIVLAKFNRGLHEQLLHMTPLIDLPKGYTGSPPSYSGGPFSWVSYSITFSPSSKTWTWTEYLGSTKIPKIRGTSVDSTFTGLNLGYFGFSGFFGASAYFDNFSISDGYSPAPTPTPTPAPPPSGPVLTVMPVNNAVGSASGRANLGVSNTGGGTMSYSASVSAGSDWLSITAGASGGNSGTIRTYFTENTGVQRTGQIMVMANGASRSPTTVIITQAARPVVPTPTPTPTPTATPAPTATPVPTPASHRKFTFDEAPTQQRGTSSLIPKYEEKGFLFKPAGEIDTVAPYRLGRHGGGESGSPENGTNYLQLLYGGSWEVSALQSEVFNAVSIDLAEYSTVYPIPALIGFKGTRADGSTVAVEFQTDGIIDGTGPAADFQTFRYPDTFQNLIRLEATTQRFSLDNLVLDVKVTPTPTPVAGPVLSVTPGSSSVTKVSGRANLNVSNTGRGTMSYSSSVSAGSNWLSITAGASGGNSGIIRIFFAENSGVQRTGQITVMANGAGGSPTVVTITQAGRAEAPTPTPTPTPSATPTPVPTVTPTPTPAATPVAGPVLVVTPASVTMPTAGGRANFTVSNTGRGTLSYSSSVSAGSNWLSITAGGSGGNSGMIRVLCAANTGVQRTGQITVMANGASGSPTVVTITQAGR